jgi:hypothetical protein
MTITGIYILIHFFAVDGGWSNWEVADDNECEVNSGSEWVKPKWRTCSNPFPLFEGLECHEHTDGGNLTIAQCSKGIISNMFLIVNTLLCDHKRSYKPKF